MNHRPRVARRAVRSLLIAAAVATTTLAGAVPAGAAARPALTLEASRADVTVYRYTDGEDAFMEGDLGVYAVADLKQAFRVKATRASYDRPIAARLVRTGKNRTLPAPADFGGLTDFSRTTFRDGKGAVVATTSATFCPNAYETVRRSPKAPATSPFPQGCDSNPYSLGAVWGLQAGYAVSLTGGGYDDYGDGSGGLPDLRPGSYTATTYITPAYRKALRIPDAKAVAKVRVNVVEVEEEECDDDDCRQAARTSSAAAAAAASRTERAPPSSSVERSKPSGPLPDLRSLPAWGIVADGHYLNFSATVWNAGPGRLVVDGFRDQKDADLMNAYQYFFTAKGKQKGYAPVGGMEWDARGHHQHWHFKDFARYSLVSGGPEDPAWTAARRPSAWPTPTPSTTPSRAPTGGPRTPTCRRRAATARRSACARCSTPAPGDTYEQFREGQAFDLTGVKNGTYYIEVAANPDKVLYEGSRKNNVSLRKVVIGGAKNKRTVVVEKVGVVVEPPVELERRRAPPLSPAGSCSVGCL